jgi:hypothetical protein
MMCIYATFGVVGVFLVRAPTRLVLKHVKCKWLHCLVYFIQISQERAKVEQAVWHMIILNAFVLEVAVDLFNIGEISEAEVVEVVWVLVVVVGNHQGPIEPVVAKEF